MNVLKIIIIVTWSFSFLYSCNCQELPPPEEAYEMSNAVFSGRATNIIEDWDSGFMEISIEVFDVWKGAIDNQIIMLSSLDDCGYYFQINEDYLIYAYYYQMDYLWTDICTRTNLLEDSEEDLDYLNSLNDNQIHLGDINFDGEINILDVVLLVSFILGDPTDELEYTAADINGDSIVNILDIIQIVNIILA